MSAEEILDKNGIEPGTLGDAASPSQVSAASAPEERANKLKSSPLSLSKVRKAQLWLKNKALTALKNHELNRFDNAFEKVRNVRLTEKKMNKAMQRLDGILDKIRVLDYKISGNIQAESRAIRLKDVMTKEVKKNATGLVFIPHDISIDDALKVGTAERAYQNVPVTASQTEEKAAVPEQPVPAPETPKETVSPKRKDTLGALDQLRDLEAQEKEKGVPVEQAKFPQLDRLMEMTKKKPQPAVSAGHELDTDRKGGETTMTEASQEELMPTYKATLDRLARAGEPKDAIPLGPARESAPVRDERPTPDNYLNRNLGEAPVSRRTGTTVPPRKSGITLRRIEETNIKGMDDLTKLQEDVKRYEESAKEQARIAELKAAKLREETTKQITATKEAEAIEAKRRERQAELARILSDRKAAAENLVIESQKRAAEYDKKLQEVSSETTQLTERISQTASEAEQLEQLIATYKGASTEKAPEQRISGTISVPTGRFTRR